MSETILTREQLEERLATLHKASLELVKDISLESLLERIATLACEQAGAQYAAVGVLNERGRLEKFIPVGMTSEQVGLMAHPPVGVGLIGALMNTTEAIRLPSIAEDPRSSGFPQHHPDMTSFLGVPIRLGDAQLGQIYLTNKVNGAEFTADDQRVIEMLAAYAAVAISNARAMRRLTERNENLALLNELATSLASSDNPDQVLEKVLIQVMEYLRLDVGEVFLRQEEGRVLKMLLHRGETIERIWAQADFRFGEGVVGATADSAQPILLDMRGISKESHRGNYLHPSIPAGQLKQIVCFPLAGQREVLGVLCVGSSEHDQLDELEMSFLTAISAWVGMALENLRLNRQQRRLAVLEERERIGMDLHDGIIQDIYAVGLTLEHARLLLAENPSGSKTRIEQAINDLNSTIRDIRAYILDLRPRKLHEEDLIDGLRRLMAEFRANTLIETNLQDPPQSMIKLPKAHATALFHITQEALANIGKHASAKHVSVSLWTTPDRVLLEISDDGHGFDVENTRLTLGHGLSNMHTRAQNAGGDLEVSSEPGTGTTILAWVPNAPAQHES